MKRSLHRFRAEVLFAALVASCASASPTEEQPQLFFPLPPEKPRIQYLTFASGSKEVVQQKRGLAAFALGEDTSAYHTISKPYGVAVRDGVIYVCDTKRPSIARIDFKERTYGLFGTRGGGALRKPINIAIDPLGYKFVTDTVRRQIVVFGPDDSFVKAFDLPAACNAVDLAIFGGEIFVLDNDDTCQVLVLDRVSGEELRSFGSQGQEPGEFFKPSSLSLDTEGNIYVADTLNNRIQKLSPTGEPIWQRGGAGYRLGQFGRPRGIRVGPDGVVYVVESAMQLVQMFDSEGNTLMRFGGPGNIPGAMVLPATLAVDASSIPYFEEFAHPDFEVEYLLFVTNQFGPHLVNVYAFGGFPEGYRLGEGEIATLAPLEGLEEEIGPIAPEGEIPALPGEHPEVPPEEGTGAGEGDPEVPAAASPGGEPEQELQDGSSNDGRADDVLSRSPGSRGNGLLSLREKFSCKAVRHRPC